MHKTESDQIQKHSDNLIKRQDNKCMNKTKERYETKLKQTFKEHLTTEDN